ncbi:MAG: YIP1 family protein [Candidatus Eisenbacteria bacterium]
MSFADAIRTGIEIVKLNRAVIREVAEEPQAFSPALLISAITGLAMCLYVFHFALHIVITGPLLGLALLFLGGVVLHFVATLFNGQGEFLTLLRTLGTARVLGWLWVVPFVGLIVDLFWGFVVAIVILEELYHLNRTQAVLTVALPGLALLLVWVVLLLNMIVLGGLFGLGRFS